MRGEHFPAVLSLGPRFCDLGFKRLILGGTEIGRKEVMALALHVADLGLVPSAVWLP